MSNHHHHHHQIYRLYGNRKQREESLNEMQKSLLPDQHIFVLNAGDDPDSSSMTGSVSHADGPDVASEEVYLIAHKDTDVQALLENNNEELMTMLTGGYDQPQQQQQLNEPTSLSNNLDPFEQPSENDQYRLMQGTTQQQFIGSNHQPPPVFETISGNEVSHLSLQHPATFSSNAGSIEARDDEGETVLTLQDLRRRVMLTCNAADTAHQDRQVATSDADPPQKTENAQLQLLQSNNSSRELYTTGSIPSTRSNTGVISITMEDGVEVFTVDPTKYPIPRPPKPFVPKFDDKPSFQNEFLKYVVKVEAEREEERVKAAAKRRAQKTATAIHESQSLQSKALLEGTNDSTATPPTAISHHLAVIPSQAQGMSTQKLLSDNPMDLQDLESMCMSTHRSLRTDDPPSSEGKDDMQS